jgi:hypothetical protein
VHREPLLPPRLRDFLRHTFEATSCGLRTVPVRDQRANAVAANKSDRTPAATAITSAGATPMAALHFPSDAYLGHRDPLRTLDPIGRRPGLLATFRRKNSRA